MKMVVLVVLVIVGVVRVGVAQQCGPTPNGVRKCNSGNCCSQYGYCGKTDKYCKEGCQKDYGSCPNGCFPGSARVMTKSGVNTRVSDLAIGDQVAVRNHNGEVEYSDVYAHGHFDKDAVSDFVVLKLKHQNENESVTQTLELTPDHFTIILQGKHQVYKMAKDVRVHDKMSVTMDYIHFTPFIVFDVSRQTLIGLYNPFSLRGNILVNNVLASCHSEWFLDSIFHRLNLVHLLPSIYQGILTPARVLYHSMGRDKYKIVYSNLDSKFGIEKSGVKMNGYLQLLAMAMLPSSAVPVNHVKQLDIAKI